MIYRYIYVKEVQSYALIKMSPFERSSGIVSDNLRAVELR